MINSFDFAPLLRAGLPPAAAKFTGVPKYNFVGGHGDPDQFPVGGPHQFRQCWRSACSTDVTASSVHGPHVAANAIVLSARGSRVRFGSISER